MPDPLAITTTEVTPPSLATPAAPAAGQEPHTRVLIAGTASWFARIARGDQSAFAEFYAAWFDRCYQLARSLTRRDESFCLDVVQEAMLRVARRVPPLEADAQAARWMVRVVHSSALDLLRRESRARRRERLVARSEGDQTPPIAHDEWLREVLDRIDEQDRALVSLRFGRGATLEAVGLATGATGDAAHGRLRRLVARLRRLGTPALVDSPSTRKGQP